MDTIFHIVGLFPLAKFIANISPFAIANHIQFMPLWQTLTHCGGPAQSHPHPQSRGVPRDKAWDERKRVSFPRGIPQGNPLDPDPRFRRVTL